MRSRIRKWLGLEAESTYVQDYFDFSNMKASMVMSAVIIALEVWMILNLVYTLAAGTRQRSPAWIAGHIISYLLLLLIALLMLAHARRCLAENRNPHPRTRFLCCSFAFVSIAFGMYISYHDYIRGEQIFAFLSMLVFALCLLVWKPVTTLILSVLSFLIMYMIMAYVDGASYATRINFFVMWICITMSAIANYHQRMSEARKDEDLEQANAYLRMISLTDGLTGMRNRRGMNEDMEDYLGRDLLVLMADVDNFKYINDTYGHETGDQVLREMAARLCGIFSSKENSDAQMEHVACYRFGGDEFLLIADNRDRSEILDKMGRWQEDLFHIGLGDTGIRVLCSCGYVYGTPENKEAFHDMIRFADKKLYEAQHLGRMRMLGEDADSVARKEADGTADRRMLTESETDSMTGLPNTLYFREHADKLLKDQTVQETGMVFLHFDIENFKAFNEKYGFQSGDVLLRRFAGNLDTVFAGSLVARASDDHFIVLTYEEGCMDKIDRLHTQLHSYQREVKLELKTGIYKPDKDESNASLACDRARIACNSVKKHFDQDCRVYDKVLEERLHRRQYIVSKIDEAIEKDYIKVYYQPVVWLSNKKLCGLEALARWDDPQYGLLPPGEFIDVLEEYRQIHKLDMCVVRQVCRDLKQVREDGKTMIPVSLNFSRLDFELCDIVTILEQTADEFDIPYRFLDVEITESALADHPEFLAGALDRLREDGFHLWLDDFGSGYSSLNVLKDFQFDVLKIDMKFLSDFSSNEKSKPILNNVVRMANEISLCPLTEGVETDDQVVFLHAIGCERAQGYFFGKPMEKGSLSKLIRDGKLQISEELEALPADA